MHIENLSPAGLKLITPEVHGDERGFFLETWQAERYRDAGFPDFVQDNHSCSANGVLRGLHFTITRPQAQLVYVTCGEIFDVAVDLRANSPTFGDYVANTLSADNHRQLFMPAGFAHGFLVTQGPADVHYKVTEFYDGSDEGGLNWADADVAITWPDEPSHISPRDAAYPSLADIAAGQLPRVGIT